MSRDCLFVGSCVRVSCRFSSKVSEILKCQSSRRISTTRKSTADFRVQDMIPNLFQKIMTEQMHDLFEIPCRPYK